MLVELFLESPVKNSVCSSSFIFSPVIYDFVQAMAAAVEAATTEVVTEAEVDTMIAAEAVVEEVRYLGLDAIKTIRR